jgi:tripartite-type tricarboxylate transporter receptor subunit TctC
MTRRRLNGLFAATALASAWPASANDFPSRGIRIVLPVGPGGGDTLARAYSDQLASLVKQSVIVDNKPGADGLIAMQALLSAPPDGYTLLLIGPQPMVFNPLLRANLPYKPTDLVPVIGVARSWTVLVTGTQSPYAKFADLATAMRKERDAVSLGTSGLSFQVGATLLGTKMGGRFRHVSYKSHSQVVADLLGGVLDCALVATTDAEPLVAGGKLRVLAVASRERVPSLAAAPTVRELGVDFDFALWTALAVRAGTPPEVIRKLEADLRKVLTSQAMRDFVAKQGTTLSPVSGADILAEVQSGLTRFKAPVAEIAAEMGVESTR